MALQLYDTLRRAEVPFEPRDPGKVSMYVCGPTVQSDAHIGHGRSQVVFDTLRRLLTWSGYEVTYVRNVTDIDDKIINRAAEEGTTAAAIATTYNRRYDDVMVRLGVLPPDIQPFATGHIFEMQALIADLVEAGKAYESQGNVLFRVRTFDGYGKLSGRKIDDLQVGEDVVASDVKEDPLDFAMWKAAKPGEPSWPSPWGDGRPGWHIECSAMASKHLGHGFDIHGGGLDLIFPHHENEITQYEAVHGPDFARYWVHNGMVQMAGDKMSKSVGNVISLSSALSRWGRSAMRLWYLSAHHRSPLLFDEERLDEAGAALDRLVTFVRTAGLVLTPDPDGEVDPDLKPSSAAEPFVAAFRRALEADLNTPAALAAVHDLVTEGNDRLGAAERGDASARPDVRALGDALVEMTDDVLGLEVERSVVATRALSSRVAPLVEAMLADRAQARADKDFERADAIRDQLTAAGVVLEDGVGGTRWFVGAKPGDLSLLTAS